MAVLRYQPFGNAFQSAPGSSPTALDYYSVLMNEQLRQYLHVDDVLHVDGDVGVRLPSVNCVRVMESDIYILLCLPWGQKNRRQRGRADLRHCRFTAMFDFMEGFLPIVLIFDIVFEMAHGNTSMNEVVQTLRHCRYKFS